jgi:hypothetical protein
MYQQIKLEDTIHCVNNSVISLLLDNFSLYTAFKTNEVKYTDQNILYFLNINNMCFVICIYVWFGLQRRMYFLW